VLQEKEKDFNRFPMRWGLHPVRRENLGDLGVAICSKVTMDERKKESLFSGPAEEEGKGC